MIETATVIASLAFLVAIVAGLTRLVRGPTILDRILAFDMIAISSVAMIGLLSIRWHTGLFLELILIFSMLGFFGTVALVYYLHQTLPEYKDNPTNNASSHQGGNDHE